jgi:hypothetical protein
MSTLVIIISNKIKHHIEYNRWETKTRGRGMDSVLIIIANLTFLFILSLLKVINLF